MKYLAIMAFLVMVKVVSFKAFVVNVKCIWKSQWHECLALSNILLCQYLF
jgi:hypothetical protein